MAEDRVLGRGELEELEVVDAYVEWQRVEGVPVVRGFYVEDLGRLELGEWERRGRGVRGAFVNLEGTGGVNDMQVLELPPGGRTEAERHLYEAMVYVLRGRGFTSVWYEGVGEQTFEWGEGSLFAVPLNAWYQHFNGSGVEVARLVAVTNAPTVLKLFHSWEFVFANPFVFRDRFSGEPDYFSGQGKLYRRRYNHALETNFVADVRKLQLHPYKERGGGGTNVHILLAHNSTGAHISQFQVGTYKKAHRHGPGAHVIILDGVGYTLLWREGDKERVKCDWRPGAVVVPPENWFHQHFNTGPTPARYLALRYSSIKYRQPGSESRGEGSAVSIKQGGWQIEYEDEDPAIHRLFEAELARHGATCRMRSMIPWCTGEAGPVEMGGGDGD